MRHLDGDERDAGLAILRRHDRRDVLVGLELDDEIDLLTNEHVRIPLRDLRAVAVVDADELDALRRRRPLQAGRDLFGELVVGALCRVAQSIRALLERTQVRSVEVLADLLDHPAAFERVEQTERHALRQSASRRHLAQRQRLARTIGTPTAAARSARPTSRDRDLSTSACRNSWVNVRLTRRGPRMSSAARPYTALSSGRIMPRRFALRNARGSDTPVGESPGLARSICEICRLPVNLNGFAL